MLCVGELKLAFGGVMAATRPDRWGSQTVMPMRPMAGMRLVIVVAKARAS